MEWNWDHFHFIIHINNIIHTNNKHMDIDTITVVS